MEEQVKPNQGGVKLNVGGNKLGDRYGCRGHSWLHLYWIWLLNTGAPKVLCGLRELPLSPRQNSRQGIFSFWGVTRGEKKWMDFPSVLVQ